MQETLNKAFAELMSTVATNRNNGNGDAHLYDSMRTNRSPLNQLQMAEAVAAGTIAAQHALDNEKTR